MTTEDPLSRAIEIAGLQPLARACDVTYQAIRKWKIAKRLPESEHSGRTTYARLIAKATSGEVSEGELLEWSRAGWQRTAENERAA